MKQGEGIEVDQDLALERAQTLLEDLTQPVLIRRLWGELARLLARRGAKPRGRHKPKDKRRGKRGARGAARKRTILTPEEAKAWAQPECKACGGTGLSSKGRACSPCKRNAAKAARA